jgi:cytochrome c peroxidase
MEAAGPAPRPRWLRTMTTVTCSLPTRRQVVTRPAVRQVMVTKAALVRSIRAGLCIAVAVVVAGGMAGPRPSGGSRPRAPVGRPRSGGVLLPSVQLLFERQLDELLAGIDTLAGRIRAGRTAEAQQAFRRARTAYKRAEGLLAYYAPEAVTSLQGPLETEGEDDVLPRPYNMPGAFPSVESALFPQLVDSARAGLLEQVRAMHERVAVVRSAIESVAIEEISVLDAARAEVARVSTLDIAGFDSDREDDALLDAAAALDGVRETIASVGGPESEAADVSRHRAAQALLDAAGYLRDHATFESMDRLTFVARYSVPASHALAELRAARGLVGLPPVQFHLWRDESASVYDSDAFDATAYAGRYRLRPEVRAPIIALGARLFADPRLSGPRTRACTTCHVPIRAFTDGLAKRLSLVPGATPVAGSPPPRHTPTLVNAALQPAEFDDERARTLEQQVAVVLANPDEMGSSIDTAVRRVSADSGYRGAFAAAFGAPPDRAVTPVTLRIAIASYVRSLVALNSPFDRAVRGDSAAMSPEARRGFTVFMGKGRCGTCHFAPLFNGTQPPNFQSSDPEIIGVPEQPALQHARLDPDSGRSLIDRVPSHAFAFKVPTVRNAALTAPYMHNGAFHTLEDVIAFYNAGGATGIGIDLPYQTLFDQPLQLTQSEQAELIAFLRSLTDTAGTLPLARSVASR